MISVIVLTSPGREDNLRACLQALCQQSWQDFEVVVADDGSSEGESVCRAFAGALSLRQLWRPHDACMSRSYNLAAAATRHPSWVLLSGDVLLNQNALGYYAVYLRALRDTVIYGYFGNQRDSVRASQVVWGRQVNLIDSRFEMAADGHMRCGTRLLTQPQAFAWGGNWALTRSLFESVGGFDEGFRGWGFEDVAFANRLLEKGAKLAFALDVWGEHQVHPWTPDPAQSAANQARVGNWSVPQTEPGLLYDRMRCQLAQALQ
ncbi:MAG: galactosyltransferase-related protein [Candidatus Sericytochromatia bacterium]